MTTQPDSTFQNVLKVYRPRRSGKAIKGWLKMPPAVSVSGDGRRVIEIEYIRARWSKMKYEPVLP